MKAFYLLLGLWMGAFLTKAQTCVTTISTFPHTQDFETGSTVTGALPTGWSVNPGSAATLPAHKWKMHAGQTYTFLTGPNKDHTFGTNAGKYVFTESVNGNAGSFTELISPCINLAGLTSPGFDFWYHMAGAGMGRMDVQVSANNGATWTTLQTYTGPQQIGEHEAWRKRTVTLAAYANQTVIIKFKGTKILLPPGVPSYEGDMAIDDVKFYNIPAVDLEMIAITSPVSSCGYGAAETITIEIKNNGTIPTTSFPVSYRVNTNSLVQETANLVIAPGATATYNFTTKANLSTYGSHNIFASVTSPADADATNNIINKSINLIPAISNFPYFENFESGTGDWVTGGQNSSWRWASP